MIRHWTVRRRLLLIALLPTTLLTLALTAYLITTRVADLRESQGALGRAIVSQLAPASVYGVFTRNRVALQVLANAALGEADVDGVAIRDREGNTLAAAARPPLPPGTGLWERLAARLPVRGEELVFRAPIVLEAAPRDEADPYLGGAGARAASQLGEVVISLSQRRFAERLLEVIGKGAAITLLLLASSVFLALGTARSLDMPLRRVTAAMRRFRDGQLGARVPERSGGELGELEHGVNTMADAIQRAQQHLQEQVEQATIELRQSLEAVEIKNVELDLARKRALAASRVKSEFLANMSHEIRTPMNAILGFTQLLSKTRLDGDQGEYLDTIQRSARSLLALLDDVLNLSRIEAGKTVLDESEFDPVELVEHLFVVHAPEAYRKGVELVLVESPDLPATAFGDAGKIQQVVNNLLHNAVKFTDRGAVTVRVGCQAAADAALYRFEVIDTGRGIPPDAQERLFQPFTQLEAADQRRQGGMGLGLAICRKLIETLGGTVSATSAPGAGSRFVVSLPLRAVAPGAPRPRPLAGVRVLLCETAPEYADALALRLAAGGAEVEHQLELAALTDALAHAPAGLTVVVLGLHGDGDEEEAAVAAWRAAAPERALLLVKDVDRAEQRRIARRFGAVCLPRYVGRAALIAELERLLESRAAPDATSAVALDATLDALDADVRAILAAELPAQRAQLAAAFAADDTRTAHELAHRVRGSAAFCRLAALEHCAATAEDLLRDGAPVPQELRARLDGLMAAVAHAAADGDAARAAPRAAAIPVGSRLAGYRVLVADDNRVNRELLLKLLALQGAHVEAVADATEAIARLGAGAWDALLMDLHMPGMDGIAAAAAVRALPAPVGSIALIAVTANALPEIRETALASGFDEYLVKPVSEEQMIETLRRTVAQRADGVSRSA